MAYIITFSIILHLITIFWIVLLTQKINNQRGIDQPDKLKSEIEDLLVAYTTEMKEDNERLFELISVMKESREKMTKDSKLETMNEQYRGTNDLSSKQVNNSKKNIDQNKLTTESNYTPPESKVEDTFEQSVSAQVLLLSKKGYSVKEIAKRLDMGNGEVELFLKFHQ